MAALHCTALHRLVLLGGHLLALVPDFGEEDGGEVPLAKGRDDARDELAGVLWPLGQLQGRRHRRAAADPHEEALLQRQPARHGHRVVAAHLHHLVDQVRVQNAGNESSANPLDLVRARSSAGKDGRLGRLHRHHLHVLLLRLEVPARAGDGAASADTADENVHVSRRVLPNLRPGRLVVDLRVRRVLELLKHVGVLGAAGDGLGLLDGALHALGRVSQDEVGAKGLEEDAALHGHGRGHGEDELVPERGRDEGEADARVPARGLHQRRLAGGDLPLTLRLVDHVEGDAVLDGVARVHGLELGRDGAAAALADLVEEDQRGLADELGDVVRDVKARHGPAGAGRHRAEPVGRELPGRALDLVAPAAAGGRRLAAHGRAGAGAVLGGGRACLAARLASNLHHRRLRERRRRRFRNTEN
mmetsp:Transcript_4154/g.10641  ORF Transcript_4154/g.10641 Transcript_4154/m.10641 type:complete len:417 (+) Transcript_4154:161-1411(+)